ncbi:MAG: hypothetical protein KGZ83_14135 [Sulfuricella sp.]|nr:hypothetical protein [Sulfuricella sp.]
MLLTATPAPQTDDADKAPVIEIPQDGEPASLAFLRSVMHHPDLDVRIRMEAAKTLAPYEATRKGDVGKRKDAADAAKKAGTGKFAPSLPPRTASVLPFPPQDSTERE